MIFTSDEITSENITSDQKSLFMIMKYYVIFYMLFYVLNTPFH